MPLPAHVFREATLPPSRRETPTHCRTRSCGLSLSPPRVNELPVSFPDAPPAARVAAAEAVLKRAMRAAIVEEGRRPDGRGIDETRDLTGEVRWNVSCSCYEMCRGRYAAESTEVYQPQRNNSSHLFWVPVYTFTPFGIMLDLTSPPPQHCAGLFGRSSVRRWTFSRPCTGRVCSHAVRRRPWLPSPSAPPSSPLRSGKGP